MSSQRIKGRPPVPAADPRSKTVTCVLQLGLAGTAMLLVVPQSKVLGGRPDVPGGNIAASPQQLSHLPRLTALAF